MLQLLLLKVCESFRFGQIKKVRNFRYDFVAPLSTPFSIEQIRCLLLNGAKKNFKKSTTIRKSYQVITKIYN